MSDARKNLASSERPAGAGGRGRVLFVIPLPDPAPPELCKDLDADCMKVPQPDADPRLYWAQCWRYDPAQGLCPFLD